MASCQFIKRVYLLDLPQAKERADILLQKITEEGGRGAFIPMDVTSEADWETAVRTVVSETGRIDVLVNNAGSNIRKVVEEMAFDEWMQMMAVNTGSVFLGTKYVIPAMKEQKEGLIINMSSVCGLVGHMYTPEAYTATKGAVTMFTRAVAARYAKFGICCSSIHPSTVDTPFIREQLKDPDSLRSALERYRSEDSAKQRMWQMPYSSSFQISLLLSTVFPWR